MAEYIEREALLTDLRGSYDDLKQIYNGLQYDEERRICSGELNTFMECIMRVKDAPAADVVEVRRGEWILFRPRRMGRNATYKCSCCGKLRSSYYNDVQEWKFCPCGAKMDGKGEGE